MPSSDLGVETNMKRVVLSATSLIALVVLGQFASLSAHAGGQDDKLSAEQLKAMLEGLAYTVKTINSEVGKEKFEFPNTSEKYNVPIGAEISPSKNYIWLTVHLGQAPSADTTPAAKFEAMLKANASTQPNFFYITSKGNLMMAVAIDNRNVNAAVIKRNVDKLVGDVAKNDTIWKP